MADVGVLQHGRVFRGARGRDAGGAVGAEPASAGRTMPDRRRVAGRLGGVALGALLAVLVFAGAADARRLAYCGGYYPSGHACSGPRHSITLNEGSVTQSNYNPSYICVAAQNTDGSAAGSWVCGNGYASHVYCGCRLRYPWVQNGGNVPYYAIGYETY